MSLRARVCDVKFVNNATLLTAAFSLEITFELYEDLKGDFEFELVYVGSATDSNLDQVLDSVIMGPLQQGRHRFVFDAPAPDLSKCAQDDIHGVTLLILSVRYIEQRFMSIKFFVANEYTEQELVDIPPTKPIIEKLRRFVKDENEDVRVTFFTIDWDKIPELEDEIEA